MTTTMLPPSHERDTEPPENARESSAPPADLGPAGLALRLLALEEQVGDIHAETLGISKAFHDIRNAITGIRDSLELLAKDYEILVNDARGQRIDRARVRTDLDELERRVTGIERNEQ